MTAANALDLDALRNGIKATVSVVEYTSARMGVEWARKGSRHVAHCIYHEESTPSWTVEDASPSRAYCYGCETHADVIRIARDHLGLGYREALLELAAYAGIPVDDLDGYTPPPRPAPRPKEPRPERKPKARRLKLLRTRRWEIRSTDGVHVATHVREDWLLEEGGEGKGTWWELPNRKPGLGGLKTADLPLYRSEHVADYPPGLNIYLTEGEADSDALTEAGYYAVGTVTGAGGCPSAASLEVLRGRDVVMWRDDDASGLEHAVRVCRALEGIAESVRIYCRPVEGEQGAGAADHPAIRAEIERRRARSERGEA